MAGLITTVQPAIEPITSSDTKLFLKIDLSDDDAIVTSLIKASREYVESFTGRSFINRTFKLSLDGIAESDVPLWEGTRVGPDINYRKRTIPLWRSPVSSVTSIITYDDADNATTFSASSYYVDTSREPAQVILRSGSVWPSALRVGNAIEITYVAGYGSTASSVPEAVKIAMYQICSYLYENRGDNMDGNVIRMSPAIATLLQPYKILSFGTDPFAQSNNGWRWP